jgi:hypothetical protein
MAVSAVLFSRSPNKALAISRVLSFAASRIEKRAADPLRRWWHVITRGVLGDVVGEFAQIRSNGVEGSRGGRGGRKRRGWRVGRVLRTWAERPNAGPHVGEKQNLGFRVIPYVLPCLVNAPAQGAALLLPKLPARLPM